MITQVSSVFDCCEGVAEKSKGEYLKIITSVYDAILICLLRKMVK